MFSPDKFIGDALGFHGIYGTVALMDVQQSTCHLLSYPTIVVVDIDEPAVPPGRRVNQTHRRFLHVLTPFRTALLKSIVQRTCPFESAEFIEQMRWLSRELPSVTQGLMEAKESIVAVCVVPSRHALFGPDPTLTKGPSGPRPWE